MRATAVIFLIPLFGAPGAAAQATRVFYLHSARDTLFAERFQQSPGRVEGELISPANNQRWSYTATLGADGLVTRMTNEFRFAGDSTTHPPRQSADMAFQGDSVILKIRSDTTTKEQRIGTRAGAMPYVNPSFLLVELALRRARILGGDSVVVPLFSVSGGQTFPLTIQRLGADSVLILLAGVPVRLAVNSAGAIQGGQIPSQGLTIGVSDRLDPKFFRAVKIDYSAPAGAPYTAVDVRVPTSAGHLLAGTLTLPAGASRAKPVPAIVTITGSGAEERDESIGIVRDYRPFRQIADSLGRRGIAVLRMDDRGYGESGGKFMGATSQDFADDIQAGLRYLRTRTEIAGTRLGLVGHSEGGLIAPLVAVAEPSLKGVVLLAGPAFKGRQIIEYQQRYAIERDTTLNTPAKRDSAIARAGRGLDSLMAAEPWMHFFLEHDPLETARKVRVPVLILQGATDRQVTVDQAPALERAFKEGGDRSVTMRIFPETNHLFLPDPDGSPAGYSTLPSSRVRPEVVGTLVDWLAKMLAK
jgi:dipeptidyl aminopeptidase/acylaminoacyl peptidase